MITDKLKSYGAARKDMGLGIEHRQHKGLNNRAENSHLPTRRRERIMKRFKSPRQVQKFLSIHDQVANLFHFPATSSRPCIPRQSHPGIFNLGRDRGRAACLMTQVDAIPTSSRYRAR
jgi:Transposase and inactivated derivatives